MMTVAAFDWLESERRWVCWRNETRNGKTTKVPHSPHGGKAKADDPQTWNTRSAAEARIPHLGNGLGGGLGIELGDIGNGLSLGGIDLDTCRSPDGAIEPWAAEIIKKFASYTEISPSNTGAKIFFLYGTAELPALRKAMGTQHGREFKRGNGKDHPPAIELHLTNRYFTVTERRLPDTPDELVAIETGLLLWLLQEAGPAFAGKTKTDKSRSAAAFRLAREMKREGKTFEEWIAALQSDPATAAWFREKGDDRQLSRIWEKAAAAQYAGLITNKDGKPLALESNVVTLLRTHPDVVNLFALDEFHQRSMLMRSPPWGSPTDSYPRPTRDADISELLVWVQKQNIHVRGTLPIKNALAATFRDRIFHPVRDYLSALKWDGQPRLDGWLSYYLGVEPRADYTKIVGPKWMISAVARIYQPGCIAKYCLIIEGPQDLGKSTALSILGQPWFTDDIASLGSKDSAMQIGNAWIIELSELSSTRRAEISAVKGFISRTVDRFRPPYGIHVIEQPRQSILAGTVNPSGKYLHDDTGAVRFWPVEATSIDLETLRRDRDQLWAEAVHRYKAGEIWWSTDDHTIAVAREVQAERSDSPEDEPWFDPIRQWLERNTVWREDEYKTIDGRFAFPLGVLLKEVLNIPIERQADRTVTMPVARILRYLGWVSGGVRLRHDPGKAIRCWHRPLVTGGDVCDD